MNEDFLNRKLQVRLEAQALRRLQPANGLTDFCSNDYLGISTKKMITLPDTNEERWHGSTGSRLLSGNYSLIEEAEKKIAAFHHAPAGLIFNSGYDANVGLFSCVPQRGDTVLYDELCHASIRDGLRLSVARSHSFRHNNTDDLEKKLVRATGNVFVATESLFSMDGDLAPLTGIAALCERYNALLVVDEAHATGVIGEKGEGLVQHLQLESKCFARVHTFGKAVGCHGAIVLGSDTLRDYLINFSRAFIYTTAMPASAVSAIVKAYALFPQMKDDRIHLEHLIALFRKSAAALHMTDSSSAIQAIIIPGNHNVKAMSACLQSEGLDIRPILSPTVPAGMERLRIVLHAFNTEEEVMRLLHFIRFAQPKKE